MRKQIVDRSPLSLADADVLLNDYREALRHRSRQFQLIVGVANGAGFAAVAAKIVDAVAQDATPGAKLAVAMIFPSAGLFVAGMAAVGISAFLDVISADLLVLRTQRVRNKVASGKTATIGVRDKTWIDITGAYGLEAFAGLLFLAGVGYPLLVLAIRYFADGGFTW